MPKLLTDSQLVGMRKVAALGMQTEATIQRRVTSTGLELTDDPYGSDVDYEADTIIGTVLGMFHSTPTPVATVDGGALVTVNTYRFLVEAGTDIQPGDRLVIGSHTYVVADTTADETWDAFLACSLRLRE